MKVVRFQSGLGNQMFQYAFYKSLQESFDDVKADLSHIKKQNCHNGYELENIFGIKVNEIDSDDIERYEKLLDTNNSVISKIRRKYFGYKSTHFKEKEFIYDISFLSKENVVLDGYWQDTRYFENVESKIREEFKFNIEEINNSNDKNRNILKQIQNTVSVSIHIRRGDYLDKIYYKKFGAVCSLEYYKKAIDIINEKYENPVFFIFSNDITWCKENLSIDNSYYIDWNTGNFSYIDMYLMSQCKHNILANSSFSWWAAWLNENPSKEVVCPSPWFFDKNCTRDSISLNNWTRIDTITKYK